MTVEEETLLTLFNWLLNTAPAFSVSALVSLIIVLSFLSLQQGKYQRYCLLFYFCPLFIIPLLLVSVNVRTAEILLPLSFRNSPLFLSVFGLLFHTGLTWVLITRVFRWEERTKRLQYLCANLRSLGKSRLLVLALYLLELLPPLTVTFLILIVFQESMVSAPFFLTEKTVVYVAVNVFRESMAPWKSGIIATVLLAGFLCVLCVAWYSIKGLTRFLLRVVVKHQKKAAIPLATHRNAPSETVFMHIAKVICGVSALIHLGAAVSTLVFTIYFVVTAYEEIETNHVFAVIRSFGSPAFLSGIIGVVTFMSLMLLVRRLSDTTSRWFRALSCVETVVALMPPSILAAFGLIILNSKNQLLIGYMLLFGYAIASSAFWVNREIIASHRIMVDNARGLGHSFKRRFIIYFASKYGELFWPLAITVYILWIEDAIQVYILDTQFSLAGALRGLRFSLLTSGTYLGATICIIIWLTGIGLGLYLTRRRFAFIRWRLGSFLSCFLAIMFCFGLIVDGNRSAYGSLRGTEKRGACKLGSISLKAGEFNLSSTKNCSTVEIERLVLDHKGATYISLPAGSLYINTVDFRWEGTILKLRGRRDNRGKKTEVKELVIRNILAPTYVDRIHPAIVLDGVSAAKVILEGNNQGPIELSIPDSSTVKSIVMRKLYVPKLDLTIVASKHGYIDLHEVRTRYVTLSMSQPSKLEQFAIPINLEFTIVDSEGSLPKIIVRDVLIREGSEIKLKPSVGNQLAIIWLERAVFSGLESRVDTRGISTELVFEDTVIHGSLLITPGNLNLINLSRVRGSSNSSDQAQLHVHADQIGAVKIVNLQLADFTLCSKTRGQQLPEIHEFKAATITGVFRISKAFLSGHPVASLLPIYRSRFYRIVQDHGLYCATDKPVGLDALYNRKQSELMSINPIMAILLDWTTGFGVRVHKPVCTIVFLLVIQILLNLHLVFKAYRDAKIEGNPLDRVKEALEGIIVATSVETELKSTVTKYLPMCRVITWAIVSFIVTMSSIYFSQTTLQ